MVPERAALVATLLADRPALAATAATVGRLMAAARLVAMAVLDAALAATRLEEMAASEDLAALVATAAKWSKTSRAEALAALPVIPERAALAATLLAVTAAMAVAAVTAVTLMAVARRVAMVVREAAMAATRLEEMVAS